MKLSFSTLGCPDWDLDTILARASRSGFDAVDFRGYQGEMAIYTLPLFSSEARTTVQRLADTGLVVSCFSSSARLMSTPEQVQTYLEEIRHYAELCDMFGTGYIRVFGGSIGEHSREEAIRIAADTLQAMGEIAELYKVTVVMETHDDWLHASHMKAVLDRTESPAVGALWDVHHPYRMVGEAPERTLELLGEAIRCTHWKDSYPTDSGHQFCLMGKGDIPLARIASLLVQQGYDGYYTLEWEKKWHPELAEPEVAFPQYVQFMRALNL